MSDGGSCLQSHNHNWSTIINFNKKAAFTRHSDIRYDFWDREFFYPSVLDYQDSNVTLDTKPSTSSFELCDVEHDHQLREPQLRSPWDINEFIIENQLSTFINYLQPDFLQNRNH